MKVGILILALILTSCSATKLVERGIKKDPTVLEKYVEVVEPDSCDQPIQVNISKPERRTPIKDIIIDLSKERTKRAEIRQDARSDRKKAKIKGKTDRNKDSKQSKVDREQVKQDGRTDRRAENTAKVVGKEEARQKGKSDRTNTRQQNKGIFGRLGGWLMLIAFIAGILVRHYLGKIF